eukprot:TRINITY_DN26927_c0_g1_i2.p3 TRINITY_DN26927_c0_g1~~TRINITY_DN26927_c0_g1_i2.p3  ORF type:complete len:247 (+),score=80.41 TRINITY_DN26927_c0_g1_i2:199-939(+)
MAKCAVFLVSCVVVLCGQSVLCSSGVYDATFWQRYFVAAGIEDGRAARYATTFEHEAIDPTQLHFVLDRSVLRELHFTYGDIARLLARKPAAPAAVTSFDHFVAVAIPSTVNASVPAPAKSDEWATITRYMMAIEFGGFTEFDARGGWIGSLFVQESTRLIVSFCDSDGLRNSAHKVVMLAELIRADMAQECVLVIVDDRRYYVCSAGDAASLRAELNGPAGETFEIAAAYHADMSRCAVASASCA